MQKTISIIVYGRVQGVFFRQSTRETALQAGLSGTVRNHADGSVHIIATGEEELLDSFIEWCKSGPPKASVDHVEVTEQPFQPFRSFIIERS